jgi:hypothetical protein
MRMNLVLTDKPGDLLGPVGPTEKTRENSCVCDGIKGHIVMFSTVSGINYAMFVPDLNGALTSWYVIAGGK